MPRWFRLDVHVRRRFVYDGTRTDSAIADRSSAHRTADNSARDATAAGARNFAQRFATGDAVTNTVSPSHCPNACGFSDAKPGRRSEGRGYNGFNCRSAL